MNFLSSPGINGGNNCEWCELMVSHGWLQLGISGGLDSIQMDQMLTSR